MEWYWVFGGLIALLTVLILVGVPLPFAIAAGALPFFIFDQGIHRALVGTEMMAWRTWSDFVLLSVPLFVLLGEIVGRSRIGAALYDFMQRCVPVRGAPAVGSVGACAGFGAVCGSSMIGALTIGSVALPQMLRLGYSSRLASGVVAAGGTLSVLIPPSLILLFYGILTGTSIGALFIAGIIPGLLLTLFFVLVVIGWRVVKPADIPALTVGSGSVLRLLLEGPLPVLLIGLFIILSIYFGIATPTEAAAIGVVAAALFAWLFAGLTWRTFVESLVATMRTMGFLGVLLTSAVLFGYVLTVNRVPQELTRVFVGLDMPSQMILIAIVVFFLVLGMFLETVSITFMAIPAIFPVIKAIGVDPIWFGIIFTITMEMAVLTPPVGLNLFVIQGLMPQRVTLTDVIIGVLPFVGAQLLLIVLLMLFPALALWLPRLMG